MNANKLSALIGRHGLTLDCTVSPANVHDSRLYEPTLEVFEIPEVHDGLSIIPADAAYDAREICQYNQKRGIESNISVNRRSRRHPKRRGPFRFDPELYEKHNSIERVSAGSRRSSGLFPDRGAMGPYSSG